MDSSRDELLQRLTRFDYGDLVLRALRRLI